MIESILRMLNLKAKDIIRTGDSRFKELNIDIENEVSDLSKVVSKGTDIHFKDMILF